MASPLIIFSWLWRAARLTITEVVGLWHVTRKSRQPDAAVSRPAGIRVDEERETALRKEKAEILHRLDAIKEELSALEAREQISAGPAMRSMAVKRQQ